MLSLPILVPTLRRLALLERTTPNLTFDRYVDDDSLVGMDTCQPYTHTLSLQNTAVLEKDKDLTVKYDYYSRALKEDDQYQVANPIDMEATSLTYGDSDMWYKLVSQYLEHGYTTGLNSQLHHHPLLLTERSFNPPPLRQAVLELLMEDLQVPAVFFGRDATLACYACGRTTGTVVDMGYSGTTVTPVYDGYVETKGIRRLAVGTADLDELLCNVLDSLNKNTPFLPLYQIHNNKGAQRQEAIHKLCRMQVAQQCREEGSGTAVSTVNDPGFVAPALAYELPDGTTVDIPAKNRFGVAHTILGGSEGDSTVRENKTEKVKKNLTERMHQGEAQVEDETDDDKEYYEQVYSEGASVGLLKRRQDSHRERGDFGTTTWRHLQKACAPFLQAQQDYLTSSPVPAMVCDAAFRCDRDQQAQLLANVVMSGGGACLGPSDQALPEFVREQVEAIIHQHTPGWRVKVLSPSMTERSICSWLGGSILGSLGTFHDMWITKKEYDEWGSAIVNRKCP